MMYQFYIKSKSVFDFLQLFEENDLLKIDCFSGTLHHSIKSIDSQILDGKYLISDLLNLSYNLADLVSFEGYINGISIKLCDADYNSGLTFRITCFEKELVQIKSKIELNTKGNNLELIWKF